MNVWNNLYLGGLSISRSEINLITQSSDKEMSLEEQGEIAPISPLKKHVVNNECLLKNHKNYNSFEGVTLNKSIRIIESIPEYNTNTNLKPIQFPNIQSSSHLQPSKALQELCG